MLVTSNSYTINPFNDFDMCAKINAAHCLAKMHNKIVCFASQKQKKNKNEKQINEEEKKHTHD